VPFARRSLTALLVGAALTTAANLPPQHGHPYRPGHSGVVHRHVSLHVAGGVPNARFSDSDGLIIWIDNSYVSDASGTLGQIDAALPESALHAPALGAQRARLEADVSRIHGPPRRSSGARAPPLHLSL
jgi:hypothetical protein